MGEALQRHSLSMCPKTKKSKRSGYIVRSCANIRYRNRRRSAIFLDAANDDETSNAGDDAGDSSEAEPEPEV